MPVHPLQRNEDELSKTETEITRLKEDMYFSPMTKEQTTAAQTRIIVLQEKRDLLKERYEYIVNFIRKMQDIKSGKVTKEEKPESKFDYFRTNLKPWNWDYTSQTESCDHCGKTTTRATAVVQLFDPCTIELVCICTNCYIKRFNLAQIQNSNDIQSD